jgi:hypothetical protein
VSVDGVEGRYACGTIGLEVFAPSGRGDGVTVVASVTGGARFLLRLDAIDLDAMPAVTFRPPVLTLRGDAVQTGGIATVQGFAGCGLSYEPKGKGGFVDDCGPSWQPVPDHLSLKPGGSVKVALEDGWEITGISGAMVRDTTILASGRDPGSASLPVTMGVEGITFDAPPLGVWGIRLTVTATKGGAAFSVPYYAGVFVADN